MAYPTPDWLRVSPSDFLAAINSGAQAGIHVANLRNQAQESADRLAQAANEASANRAAAADRTAQEVALHSWEAGERLRQQAKELADLSSYRTGELGNRLTQLSLQAADEDRKNAESKSKHDYFTGKLQLEGERADRPRLIKSGNDIYEHDPVTGDLVLRQAGRIDLNKDPTAFTTITEKIPASKGKPAKPASEGIPLLGWGAHGPIAAVPEQLEGTRTRKVRNDMSPETKKLSTPPAPVSTKRIRVRAPNGSPGTISDDPDTIAAAKDAGYEILQ